MKIYRFCFLEPFYGGSHKDFAEGLLAHSRHDFQLYTLPARFWKWRMRGAALHFIKQIENIRNVDGIIATDLMSLADFKAMLPERCPPSLLYFHENQFTYPLAPGESMDYQYGFTNIMSALAADRLFFNSKFHYESFCSGLASFVKMMPDHRPMWLMDSIKEKSGILYPGCRFSGHGSNAGSGLSENSDRVPLIVWNHRWEFDKNPGEFFRVLLHLKEKNIPFQLALLGERFREIPPEFKKAKQQFGNRIVQYGYANEKREYYQWLKKGDIVISTANQENFGISIVEAVRSGCMPLLPSRLSYPEIIPPKYHARVLYKTTEELETRLEHFLTHTERYEDIRIELSEAMGKFSWEHMAVKYDLAFEELVRRGKAQMKPKAE